MGRYNSESEERISQWGNNLHTNDTELVFQYCVDRMRVQCLSWLNEQSPTFLLGSVGPTYVIIVCNDRQLKVSERYKSVENFSTLDLSRCAVWYIQYADIGGWFPFHSTFSPLVSSYNMKMNITFNFVNCSQEALDNHLTAVQRDHEHRSQLEERRIRDDAAIEEAKRREKALLEEKLRQEKVRDSVF